MDAISNVFSKLKRSRKRGSKKKREEESSVEPIETAGQAVAVEEVEEPPLVEETPPEAETPPQEETPPTPAEAVEALKKSVEEPVDEALEEVKETVEKVMREEIEETQGVQEEEEAAEEEPGENVAAEAEKPVKRNSTADRMRPHAFVIMPFGQKKGADGQIIDFNAIYLDLIKPSLERAGFEAFRADEETVAGDILTDMFQELLLADLCICDMSIDNANVFYELGVRHAMRKRGIIHIQSGRSYMPFDVFNVRTIPYHTGKDGKPDPANLEKDIQAITRAARDTWASDRDMVHSPIFNLLTGLTEPDAKTLRTPLATGFWREYNEWKERMTVAKRQKRIGDILLLTDEVSNPLIKEEAIGEAGKAMKSMNRYELALLQIRKGLKINPKNLDFRREEALFLNRLGRVDEAIVKLENLIKDVPGDSEAIALLGRIYKDMWTGAWQNIDNEKERMENAFKASHWLIKSIQTYLKGYYCDLRNYYPGINALTLAIILKHLAETFEEKDDPEILAIEELLPNLKGTLEFSLEKMARNDDSDYWCLVSLAELVLMTTDDMKKVRRAYKKALTACRKNIFNLRSSLAQLKILESLSLRSESVKTGRTVLEDEIKHILKDVPEKDEKEKVPDKEEVFLFTGHKIGAKKNSRFVPEKEDEMRKRLVAVFDKYQGSDNDVGITAGAAAGGDIIFIEACLERGMKIDIHLPFKEPEYIKEEVSPAGDHWVERYYNIRNHERVTIRIQHDHVGDVKEGDDPYERNNRWAISSSLILGVDRLRLIALWDGRSDLRQDRAGQLVSHMVKEVRQVGAFVEHINPTKFTEWKTKAKKDINHEGHKQHKDAKEKELK